MSKLEDCPACNNPTSIEAKTCPKCGQPLTEGWGLAIVEARNEEARLVAAAEVEAIGKKKAKKNKVWGIILASIAFVIVVGLMDDYQMEKLKESDPVEYEKVMAERKAEDEKRAAEREAERAAKKAEEVKEKAATEAQRKKEEAPKIRAGLHCLRSWDGSHPRFKGYIKSNQREPSSFEHISTQISPIDKDGTHFIKMQFRGRNGFGGMVVGMATATVKNADCSFSNVKMN